VDGIRESLWEISFEDMIWMKLDKDNLQGPTLMLQELNLRGTLARVAVGWLHFVC
jgi:hypothetical protein